MEASAAESGRRKKLEVKLLDEDGSQVGGMTGEFVVANPPKPGQRIQMSTILRFTDVVFPKAELTIWRSWSMAMKAEVPMSVTLTEDAQADAN
jgi:hypothetical protein